MVSLTVPKVEVPKVEVPKAEVPEVDVPKVDTAAVADLAPDVKVPDTSALTEGINTLKEGGGFKMKMLAFKLWLAQKLSCCFGGEESNKVGSLVSLAK